MSNAKKVYSSKASEYTSGMSNAPEIVRKRFERSLLKKEMYQGNWEKVNINELVEKYTLGITPTTSGTKLMTYYGEKIPNTPFPPDSRIEEFSLNEQDCELLREDFVESINDYCDTLLEFANRAIKLGTGVVVEL